MCPMRRSRLYFRMCPHEFDEYRLVRHNRGLGYPGYVCPAFGEKQGSNQAGGYFRGVVQALGKGKENRQTPYFRDCVNMAE